jgi:hypothetical protein
MAMTQGTVSVAADGTVTKSGLAGEVYDAMWSDYTTAILAAGAQVPTDPAQLAKIRKSIAASAKGQALCIPHITTNGSAQVDTGLSGLQRVSGVDTQAPSVTKSVPLV